jgi:transposase
VGEPLYVAVAEPPTATKVTLRALARRWQALIDEVTELDALITPLVAALNPDLLAARDLLPVMIPKLAQASAPGH